MFPLRSAIAQMRSTIRDDLLNKISFLLTCNCNVPNSMHIYLKVLLPFGTLHWLCVHVVGQLHSLVYFS